MSELPEAMAGTGGQMESVLDGLSRLTDEELRGVVKHAGEILAARDKERKAEALHEIQRIAKEAGLHVGVTKPPPRKRGRPPKQEEPPG
jgi:hypothetical protein